MTHNFELEKTIWQAVDKLWNKMNAAENEHVDLGLIFLKFISVAFEELYVELKATESETVADPEDKDEYTAENVFYVPLSGRWKWLQVRANLPTIGKDIAGFCKSVNRKEAQKNNSIHTLGRNIDIKEVSEDGIAFEDKMQKHTVTHSTQMQKANEMDEAIKNNINKIGYGW